MNIKGLNVRSRLKETNTSTFLTIIVISLYLCVCEYNGNSVEVRGQLAAVGSLLGLWGLSSGCQAE